MAGTVKVVTFNIRCDGAWAHDGINAWKFRKQYVIRKIRNEAPDVIGFQEVLPHVLDELKRQLPEYLFAGCGRSADFDNEYGVIAYKKDRLELIGLDVFWLSDTPYLPGSRYPEGSDCPRICTAVVLREYGSAKPFRVYNTHLDHEGEIARIKGIQQILQRMGEDYKKWELPALLMGDFNATPDSTELCSVDAYQPFALTDATAGQSVSFHDYGTLQSKIDYIFASDVWRCAPAEIWDDCVDGVYLSDHYPVCVTMCMEG